MDKNYCILTSITPIKLIYENKIYSITSIDNDFIINKYKIIIDRNDRIKRVYIDANHPNADPNTDIFCLPEELKNRYLSNSLIKNIETMMEIYNLNNCYFMPWKFIKYDKYDPLITKNEHERREKSFIMKTFNFYNKIRNINISVIDN